jgi:5-methylcytosine-specific restriction endonuclease McrA
MTRRRLSTRERARLFDLHGGVCHICGFKIGPDDVWQVEHVIPWAMTRDDSDENRKPAHDRCHKPKTKVDFAQIAKAKRLEAKQKGTFARKSRLPGSRDSGWKQKVTGEWVRRTA